MSALVRVHKAVVPAVDSTSRWQWTCRVCKQAGVIIHPRNDLRRTHQSAREHAESHAAGARWFLT